MIALIVDKNRKRRLNWRNPQTAQDTKTEKPQFLCENVTPNQNLAISLRIENSNAPLIKY